MLRTLLLFLAAIAFSINPVAGIAQTANKPAQPAPQTRVCQEPCWQQVGISQDAIQQRDQIARDRHTQVESVCADTSLTPKQQKEKIKEIRQQAKGKMDAVITPEQEQQLQACQKERAGNVNHTSTPAAHPDSGPCGNLASSSTSNSGGTPQSPQN